MTYTAGMFGVDTTIKSLSGSQTKQIETALHNGVPAELRGQVWSIIVPNSMKITEKLYKVLIDRVRLCQENTEKDTQFRKH